MSHLHLLNSGDTPAGRDALKAPLRDPLAEPCTNGQMLGLVVVVLVATTAAALFIAERFL